MIFFFLFHLILILLLFLFLLLPTQALIVSLATAAISRRCSLTSPISCLAWGGASLCLGGEGGVVAVLGEEGAPRQILALDSCVVQVAVEGSLLVASCLTRAVVCELETRSYREVGSRLRQGGQGVALLGGRLWAARPGCRLWEVQVREQQQQQQQQQ